jgi:hypothetical protein
LQAKPNTVPRIRIDQRVMGPVLALVVLAVWPTVRANAETPAATCARLGAAATPQVIPADLVPAVNAAFGTSMPVGVAIATTVFRCADGHVLVCTTGANLPCGPANTNREPGPGAIAWCRDHPDRAGIPAVATGHDTIFAWRCKDHTPRIDRQLYTVDGFGFITQYWKQLPK